MASSLTGSSSRSDRGAEGHRADNQRLSASQSRNGANSVRAWPEPRGKIAVACRCSQELREFMHDPESENGTWLCNLDQLGGFLLHLPAGPFPLPPLREGQRPKHPAPQANHVQPQANHVHGKGGQATLVQLTVGSVWPQDDRAYRRSKSAGTQGCRQTLIPPRRQRGPMDS